MVLLLLALAAAQPASAQCPATDTQLPQSLGMWRHAESSTGHLTIGKAVEFTLTPSTGGTSDLQAELRFDAPKAGTYEVALSQAAWIDVIENGSALKSIAHRHGPPCSTIRKIVTFQLKSGPHLLRISRGQAARVKALVIQQ